MDERFLLNRYKVENVDQIVSPSLLVYPDVVLENIEKLIAQVKDVSSLRPHIKTIKCKPLVSMLINAGVYKFKCATLKEAELLAELQVQDILVAYPLIGCNVAIFINLVRKFPATKFQVIVDSHESLLLLSELAVQNSLVIPVFIDVNMGMDRTGVAIDQLQNFSKALNSYECVDFQGLHGYDGHVRNNDLRERGLSSQQAFEKVLRIASEIEVKDGVKPILVFGGSNTFPFYAQYEDVECSPGTFMLWDWGYYTNLSEQNFSFAAVVISRIISKPTTNKICIDLGYKAIASENSIDQRLHIIGHPELKPVSQSEEHLVLEVPLHQNEKYELGDVFYIVPYHICPTVAMYPYFQAVINKEVQERWNIQGRY